MPAHDELTAAELLRLQASKKKKKKTNEVSGVGTRKRGREGEAPGAAGNTAKQDVTRDGDDDDNAAEESTSTATNLPTEIDMDEEIRRLEAELAADDDDDDDSSSSGSSSSEGSAQEQPMLLASRQPDGSPAVDDNGVLCLSAVQNERIEKLPSNQLPKAPRRNREGFAVTASPKRKQHRPLTGLQKAVEEVMGGYVARSSERLPFYCRFCQKQYPNETEFFAHKEGDFHKAAVQAEKRATYCKVCRKQLTSPEQMKEHLASRPHQQKLEFLQSRNNRPNTARTDRFNNNKRRDHNGTREPQQRRFDKHHHRSATNNSRSFGSNKSPERDAKRHQRDPPSNSYQNSNRTQDTDVKKERRR